MTKRRGLTERDGNIELRELVEQLDQGKIVRTAANRRIKWGFNPPCAPHFGTARGEHCNSPENGRINHLYVHIFCRVPGISLFMVQKPLGFSRQTIT